MTCYFRHLGGVFEKAGIEVTKENRKELGNLIACMVGEADCSAIWRQVKKRLAEDQKGFVAELKATWEKREAAKQ